MTMNAATDSVAMRRLMTRSGIGLLVTVVLGTTAVAQPPAPAAEPPGTVAQPKPPSPSAGTLPQVVQPTSPTQPAPTPPALPQILRPPQPAPPPQGAPQPAQVSPPTPQVETPAPPHPPPLPIQNTPPAPSEPSQAASPPASPAVEPAPPQGQAPQGQTPQGQTPQGQTPTQPPPPAVVSAEQIAPTELTGLLGHVLLGDQGAELGRIVDLLVDTKGHVRAVVIDVGGFMGVGNRKVAVAWSALRVTTGDKGPVISTEIPPDRIKSWADYIVGRPVAILGTTASGQ
jgi:hypothetical protein